MYEIRYEAVLQGWNAGRVGWLECQRPYYFRNCCPLCSSSLLAMEILISLVLDCFVVLRRDKATRVTCWLRDRSSIWVALAYFGPGKIKERIVENVLSKNLSSVYGTLGKVVIRCPSK